jgi:hypothetical protein
VKKEKNPKGGDFMKCKEKTDPESKQENSGSSFPFERCQKMAEMMRSFCGSDKDSFDFNEMMRKMFGNISKEEEKS